MQAKKRNVLILLLAVLFLSSCGMFNPAKRLERILDKHPELIQERYTVTRLDTVIIPGKDSAILIPYETGSDTTIQINRYRAAITREPDNIGIDINIPADTGVNRARVVRELLPAEQQRIPSLEILYGMIGLVVSGIVALLTVCV